MDKGNDGRDAGKMSKGVSKEELAKFSNKKRGV